MIFLAHVTSREVFQVFTVLPKVSFPSLLSVLLPSWKVVFVIIMPICLFTCLLFVKCSLKAVIICLFILTSQATCASLLVLSTSAQMLNEDCHCSSGEVLPEGLFLCGLWRIASLNRISEKMLITPAGFQRTLFSGSFSKSRFESWVIPWKQC